MNKAHNPKVNSLNNRQVAERYGNTDIGEGHGSNLFIEGRAIYSYGHHFPIAVKTDAEYNGRPVILWNSDGYSRTTSKHQSYVWSELTNYMLIEASTAHIKRVIDCINYGYNMGHVLADINHELDALHDEADGKRERARTERSREHWETRRAEVVEMIRALNEVVRWSMTLPDNSTKYDNIPF